MWPQRIGDLSPIQRGLRIGRKGADRSDRTIGHNGEQILIPEIVAVAKRREPTLFRRALQALRTATKPLTARDIMLGMLAARGVTEATPHQVRVLTNGLMRSLMNNRGRTVETIGEGSP